MRRILVSVGDSQGAMIATGMERDSDIDGLSAVYKDEVDRIYGFAVHRVGRAEAADVVAEVFHAAALAFRDGRGQAVTRAWLMAVARNKVMDHWRRAYRRKAKLHLTHRREADLMDFPVDWAADSRREAVIVALDALSERNRSLLVLHHVDGLSTSELADELETSVRAIESALARARKKFREHYDGDRA